MRDPQRLNEFYSELRVIHQTQCPDWRFGQMIVNVLGDTDPFYWEEEKTLEAFRKYFRLQE